MSHLNIVSYFTQAKHCAKFVDPMINQGDQNMYKRGSGCNSVVRHLPSKFKALGSTPITRGKERGREKVITTIPTH